MMSIFVVVPPGLLFCITYKSKKHTHLRNKAAAFHCFKNIRNKTQFFQTSFKHRYVQPAVRATTRLSRHMRLLVGTGWNGKVSLPHTKPLKPQQHLSI